MARRTRFHLFFLSPLAREGRKGALWQKAVAVIEKISLARFGLIKLGVLSS